MAEKDKVAELNRYHQMRSVPKEISHMGPRNAPEDRELSMEQVLRFLKAPMKFRGGPAARGNKSPLEEVIGQRNKGK